MKVSGQLHAPVVLRPGKEPLVPIGCEEHRLRVSENSARRRIFGHKREEVAAGWRRLHNEELHKYQGRYGRIIFKCVYGP
jgi:hypothetical protein